jgi:hypothetical protein
MTKTTNRNSVETRRPKQDLPPEGRARARSSDLRGPGSPSTKALTRVVPTPGVAPLLAACLLAGCLLAGSLLTGCGGSSGANLVSTSPPTTTLRVPPAEEVSLDQADYGAGTGVLLGGSLTVTLPTGTASDPWVLDGSVAPELTLTSTTDSSGEQLLTFDAAKTGTVTLRLHDTVTGSSWWAVVAVFTLHFTPKNFVRPEPGIVRGTTLGP